MFKMSVTVDKNQYFKSFISQTTSIGLELSSSSAEKSFASNFKIIDYFFKLKVAIFSAVCCDGLGSSASKPRIV